MDGSFGYNHRRFTRFRRAVQQDQPLVVADIAAAHVLDLVKGHGEVELSFERSERLKALEEWGLRWRRRIKRVAPHLPLTTPVKVGVSILPEAAIMYSRGVGSYDLRTPEVQRYEESVHFGGSGGMII